MGRRSGEVAAREAERVEVRGRCALVLPEQWVEVAKAIERGAPAGFVRDMTIGAVEARREGVAFDLGVRVAVRVAAAHRARLLCAARVRAERGSDADEGNEANSPARQSREA